MNDIQNQINKTPIEIALGIDENGNTTAKKLYEFLQMDKSQYARWYKSNILENPFAIENEDFKVLDINVENSKGGRPTQDFKLSANFAKKLSMQGKTERAEQARNYFIMVEDKLKQVAAAFQKAKIDKLTITSQELTILAKEKQQAHHNIMFRIRECITELQEMGLNPDDYFIKSEYLAGNNEMRPQYLVTEQGCEYYASRITLNRRNDYRSEYMLRFDQLRALADGKPLTRLPKVICLEDVEEKEPFIKLYKTDSGGIVLINDEIHNLTSNEIETLSRFIPEMQKQNIGQIQYVVSAFLRSMKKSGKLEEIASWGIGQAEELQKQQAQPLLLPKTDIDLNQVENLTVKQAQQRYSMSRTKILEAANKAGAIIKSGRRYYFSRKKMDSYFERQTY